MKVNQPGVKSVSKILKNIFVTSGAFAIATLVLVGLAGDTLPYSRTRDRITDALASPGARIAGLIYPQGVHTGTGARFWGSQCLPVILQIGRASCRERVLIVGV